MEEQPDSQNLNQEEPAAAEQETKEEPATAEQETKEEPAKSDEIAQAAKPKQKFSFKKFLLLSVLPVLSSGIIRALAIFIFTTPNQFAPGGVNGVAVLLEAVTTWNSGYFLLMLNVPLFFIAFFLLGKREAILSTLSMLISSGLLIVFGLIKDKWGFPQYGGNLENIGQRMLGAIAGGIFLGIALAIMLRSCGTSGGTAVLASLVNKKFRNVSISMLTSAFDACVVVASIFVYNDGTFTSVLDPVLLAFVSLFVTSKMSDVILQGFKVAYKFEIITTHPDEIAAEIIQKTHHSVTKVEAEGMYSHEGKSMLVCIIRKRQIAVLQRIIKKYPDTFAYFTPASEVFGKFNK